MISRNRVESKRMLSCITSSSNLDAEQFRITKGFVYQKMHVENRHAREGIISANRVKAFP